MLHLPYVKRPKLMHSEKRFAFFSAVFQIFHITRVESGERKIDFVSVLRDQDPPIDRSQISIPSSSTQ
jgi:hypothetical protein